MALIGKGPCTLNFYTKSSEKNAIGEDVAKNTPAFSLNGFLDLSTGDTRFTDYNAAITESTHMFFCDYEEIPEDATKLVAFEENGKEYDVKYIDDPMGLHEHLEIYLRYTG
jgi:hypothetical protein